MTQEEQAALSQEHNQPTERSLEPSPFPSPQEGFKLYCDTVYKGHTLSRIQEQEIRRAFYAGMVANFHVMAGIAATHELKQAEAAIDAHYQALQEVRRTEVGS